MREEKTEAAGICRRRKGELSLCSPHYRFALENFWPPIISQWPLHHPNAPQSHLPFPHLYQYSQISLAFSSSVTFVK